MSGWGVLCMLGTLACHRRVVCLVARACARAAAIAVVTGGLPALAPAARAQPSPTVEAIALYEGADRAQRLLEHARREGSITVYSSLPAEDMQAQVAAFEQRTGITVRAWRASGQNVLRRAAAEYRAGRHEVDILESTGPELELLQRERLVQEVRSPVLAGIAPWAIPAHRAYVGTRLTTYVLGYNTALVRPDELPQRWEDLTDRRWRGRLGMTADSVDWFMMVVTSLGVDRGLQVFRDIVATNGISLRQGHSLLSNLVASGEVPLALAVYDYRMDQLRSAGAPVAAARLEPTLGRLAGIGLASRAPRPHAAILFFEFVLTDAQRIRAERGYTPTTRAAHGRDEPRVTLIDNVEMLERGATWNDRFRSIVARQGR